MALLDSVIPSPSADYVESEGRAHVPSRGRRGRDGSFQNRSIDGPAERHWEM
jgi:hypothetical protein